MDEFLVHGAHVVCASRHGESGPAAPGSHGILSPVLCDVSDEVAVAAMFAGATEQFGTVDIVVNNAGIARDRMTHRMELSDLRAVLDVNFVGTWLVCREAVRLMRARAGGGSIVNVSSISAKAGNLGQGNYAGSKAAVVAFTKTLAREGGPHGIRANAVRPGFIDTDLTAGLDAAARARLTGDIPLGRPGLPAEVAQAVFFLASERSSYITGAVLDVSGGRYM